MNLLQGDAIVAIADPNKEPTLNSEVKENLCYSVTGYLAIPARGFRRVVQHEASIRLGDTTDFEPLCDPDIPYYFYDFATYEMLPIRKIHPQPLVGNNMYSCSTLISFVTQILITINVKIICLYTDYIGRVETVSPPLIRSGKEIKKVKIKDQWSVTSNCSIPNENDINKFTYITSYLTTGKKL